MAGLPPPPPGPVAALHPPPPGPAAALPPPPPSPTPSVLDLMAFEGGEPQRGTDGGGDPTMLTNAAGGKRPQTPQSKIGSLVKKRRTDGESSHVLVKKPPTIMKASQSRNQGIRSPMQATSSPGVNFLLKSAAVKKEAVIRASMAGSPKTPQPPSCSQLGFPSLHDLSPDTRATNSQVDSLFDAFCHCAELNPDPTAVGHKEEWLEWLLFKICADEEMFEILFAALFAIFCDLFKICSYFGGEDETPAG